MPIKMKKSSMKYKDSAGNMQDVGLPIGSGGSGETDISLTKSGVAADAKVVETRFGQLEGQIADQQTHVTPQMYGAIGDGVNDDTQAINDALASGNSVFFPIGAYKITSNLVVPTGACLSGVSGLSTIKSYITSGYVLTGAEGSTTLASANIENLSFENGNTQDETTKRISGDFVYNVTALYMRNCRVKKYYNVFHSLKNDSFVLSCRFSSIYNTFAGYVTDSVIDGCYINASRYGLPYKSKCISGSFNSSVLTNNLVDYFYSVIAVGEMASGSVVRNTFNRCVNVFHDHLGHITISNNIFTGIKSASVDLSVLTAEQIAELEAEKWCVIKFDNTALSSGTHVMSVVIFTDNVGYNCEYYFYVADGVHVVPADCEFRGNQISVGSGNQLSAVDVGFRNTESTESAYNSMNHVFFDFWDMKEYEALPSPLLRSGSAKGIVSFPYMRAVYDGNIYTNINGEWVKGGGGEEVDLSNYVMYEDLKQYATVIELSNEITSLKAQGIQQVPLFANSVEDCTDKTKVYVLPDGYIYGYIKTEVEVDGGTRPNFTNLKGQTIFNYGKRYSLSNSAFKDNSAGTAFIVPVPSSKTSITLRLKGFTRNGSYPEIYGGTSAEAFTDELVKNMPVSDSDGITTVTISKDVGITYIVFNGMGNTESAFTDTIITIDEPIEYVTGSQTVVTEAFANTGHAFVPAAYESRILALETKIAELEASIS